jgi:hypothetical protein
VVVAARQELGEADEYEGISSSLFDLLPFCSRGKFDDLSHVPSPSLPSLPCRSVGTSSFLSLGRPIEL